MTAPSRRLAAGPRHELVDIAGRLTLRAVEPAGRDVVADVAALHAEVAHRCVPAPAEVDEHSVAFDVRPLGTLAQLLERARDAGETFDYAEALGLGALLAEVWDAIRACEPTRASGRLAAGQIVFDLTGAPHFIGLGTRLTIDLDERGRTSPFVATAPEVVRGDDPVPSSDVYAAAQLATLLVPFLRFPPALSDALGSGEPSALAGAASYFASSVTTHVVAAREPSLRAVLARFDDAWSASLSWSAEDGIEALGTIALALLGPTLTSLDVRADGARFRRGVDAWVDLSRRPTLQRIVAALVADHREVGPGLSFDAMAGAGWPGERILDRAARARVHVAVSTLRKLGLGDWLEHSEGRYRLRSDLRVRVVSD